MNDITINNIDDIERKLLAMPQAECAVFHKFSPGLYIRELFMPAGTLAIGHEQKFEHFNVMLKGKVLMLNDDGSRTEISAPLSFVGKPGRKIGYVLEDMIWQNIYPTNETNIKKLEEKYLNKSDAWKENNILKQNLCKLEHKNDNDDFNKMLIDVGVTKEIVKKQSENMDDYQEIITNNIKIIISESSIEGKGLFATAPIMAGEIILPARLDGIRTQAGKYTNHSANPNAEMKFIDGNIYLIAKTEISGCRGGELGDEITIDYRQAIKETLKSLEDICQP
jgi:hypothetical protein